mmetsp:Transcript_21086/g.44994  ORF Transcript_21086/g.44994 Transcript_21086/m.44994 type:complete len:166 (+) Transcript_21086:105-602(+)
MGSSSSCQSDTKESCCACAEGHDDSDVKGGRPVRFDYKFQELSAEQLAIEAAEKDGLRLYEPYRKAADGSAKQRVVQVLVRKLDVTEQLGMNVKHRRGRLVVMSLFEGGAIARCSAIARSKSPPEETLEPGDVICQVNDIVGQDMTMVQECHSTIEVRFTALRTQ